MVPAAFFMNILCTEFAEQSLGTIDIGGRAI